MSTFAADISAFVKKANGNMDLVVRKVVLDLGTSVVFRSPVGDPSTWAGPAPAGYTGGRFRANWQYGEMTMPSGVVDATDPSGSKTIGKLVSMVKEGAAGKVHFLANNLPYAERIETGWSKQAPAGVVGLAVREFVAVVERAAALYRDRK